MLNMSAPHESGYRPAWTPLWVAAVPCFFVSIVCRAGAADASQHLADEIQARCRDLSSVLDECCTMVRQRDDMIRDDGRKVCRLRRCLSCTLLCYT
jgi:hypothetical protein